MYIHNCVSSFSHISNIFLEIGTIFCSHFAEFVSKSCEKCHMDMDISTIHLLYLGRENELYLKVREVEIF